ncbi:AraC family transcriptional regulator (plasmid) [Edwardsiella tarda]|uniref:helix-turn-helix domain-containing protein n=1 Tax=Edwardsiella tarda TaxID=636 RepID=UPI002443E302|nr:helix-turn-helix domain-containing protein [Edwardsiella tarda]WGE30845.1 AraC family transcriptional regulator [Edwardsiella tarda]
MTSNSSRHLCCQIILAKKETKLILPNSGLVILPANHFMLVLDESNRIQYSTPSECNTIQFSRQFIKDYIGFLQKKPDYYTDAYSGPEYIIAESQYVDLLMDVSASSKDKINIDINHEQSRLMIFSLLSLFIKDENFIPMLKHAIKNTITLRVYHIIKQDIRYPWRVDMIAERLSMSTSLLKNRLKQEGSSYIKIVTDCRMRYAIEQMSDMSKSIADIAAICGYKSRDYFIFVFRRHFGITPLRYMLNRQANSPLTDVSELRHEVIKKQDMAVKFG